MKKIGILLLLGCCLLQAGAQHTKNLVVDENAELRAVQNFNAIEVSGAIDLFISQGTEEAVAVSASSAEIKDRIRADVRGGVLRIYFDGKGLNWRNWGNHKMKAYVTFKTLRHLEASGACNVKAADPIRQPELEIEMSGASDFTGEIDTKKLKIHATGASNFKLSGNAAEIKLEANGASNLKAYDLQTEVCYIEASGASNIRLTVTKEINAEASGGSSVFFKGKGLIKNFSSSGGATIKRIAED